MYAVVRTGGKQYRVKEGDLLKVEKLEQPVGARLDLEVLLVGQGADATSPSRSAQPRRSRTWRAPASPPKV